MQHPLQSQSLPSGTRPVNPVRNPEGGMAPPHANVQTLAPQTEPSSQGRPVQPPGAQFPPTSQWRAEGGHDLQPGAPAPAQQLPQQHHVGPSNASKPPSPCQQRAGTEGLILSAHPFTARLNGTGAPIFQPLSGNSIAFKFLCVALKVTLGEKAYQPQKLN